MDSNATHDAIKSAPISCYCTSGSAASTVKIAGGDPGETLSIGFAPVVLPITFSVTGTIPAARINTAPAGRYFGRFPIALLP